MMPAPPGAWADLGIGSWNTHGLSPARARAAQAVWLQMRWGIVFLQETHLSPATAPAVEAALPDWQLFWGHSGSNSGSSNDSNGGGAETSDPAATTDSTVGTASSYAGAGVAIVVHRMVLRSNGGPVDIDEPSVVRCGSGRLIHLCAAWGGHSLHLASIYLPNDYPSQKQFISTQLQPLCQQQQQGRGPRQGPRHCIWGGDFNFVPEARDRRSWQQPATAAAGSARQTRNEFRRGEAGVAGLWRDSLGADLVDVWRARHPEATTFTRFGTGAAISAARLDRFYVSPGLVDSCHQAGAARHAARAAAGAYLSDHRPITLRLLPRRPVETWRGPPRRVRLHFKASPPHAADLQQQLQSLAAAAPTSPAALLAWYPQFKRATAAAAREVGRLYRRAMQQTNAANQPAGRLQQLYTAVEAGDDAAVEEIAATRAQVTRAAEADDEARQLRERREWLHHREYPSAGYTRRLRPPAQHLGVPPLRDAAGRLACTPPAIARVVVQHWAGVSAHPAVTASAQRQVLDVIVAAGSPGPRADQVQALSALAVSEAEVKYALRHTKPCTSPGLDGLPVDLYRMYPDIFVPLFARLFSAMIGHDTLPDGLLDGVISVLHKSGDRALPSNYRPITLLCTDYRLLAKILANRLGAILPSLIDPHQTAFVKGRRMGENVMALQLLPHALAAEGRGAYIAVCDFIKAYDTIDRGFLFQVMRQLGVGGAFLSFVQLLLTNTRSFASVNGCLSPGKHFHAGVRQGCPLAPLLYLFVGQALLCWLRHQGFGISAAGSRWVALQYADDTKVFLSGPDCVARFLRAMDTFCEASGQQLHRGKTGLLPIGRAPATQAAGGCIEGLTVVREARILGLVFQAGTMPPAPEWDRHIAAVEAAYNRIKQLGLSAMGRGIAGAAYGISKLLFQAEFVDLPSTQVVARLNKATRNLILAEAGKCSFLSGSLLTGAPSDGGWGGLPWHEHVRARHACWGGRIFDPAAAARPWVTVARWLMQPWIVGPSSGGRASSSGGPLGALLPPPPTPLPPPLRRIVSALLALPGLMPAAKPDGVVAGASTAAAAMAAAEHAGAMCSTPLVWLLGRIPPALVPLRVRTLGDLCRLHAIAHFQDHAFPLLNFRATRQLHGIRLHSDSQAREQLNAAVNSLPQAWIAAGRTALAASPPPVYSTHYWLAAAQHALAFRLPEGRLVAPWQLTVRAATALQLAPLRQRRAEIFAAVATLVQRPPADVLTALRRAWRAPCDNRHKQILWFLLYDALPTASVFAARSTSEILPCVCSYPCPGREHHFWQCPVAKAIIAELQRHLPAAARHLHIFHLWLGQPPPGVHPGSWSVIALAALNAMERARRRATRSRIEARNGGTAPSPVSVSAVSRFAVARLWGFLADLCALNTMPPDWRPLQHFLFQWVPDTNQWVHSRQPHAD